MLPVIAAGNYASGPMGTRMSHTGATQVVALGAGALVVCSLLLWSIAGPTGLRSQLEPLIVHCAAGIRAPVQELALQFEEQTGQAIELQLGGSGTLLAAVQAGAPGDLFIAGDASFVERAREAGVVREVIELARMKAVLGVARGNPKGLVGLPDLVRPDLRVGLGHPEATAIGRVTRSVLDEAGLWQEVLRNRKVEKPTVNDLASDLAVGALDVAIVWDVTVAGYDNLQAIRVEAFEAQPRRVTAGVLEAARQPARALAFTRWLASADMGAPTFRSHGFAAEGSDDFVERPKLVLMSGAMLRPAIQETLEAFEEREGITLECLYNGCGMLVAQMQAGLWPDAYVSCDQSFLDLVQDHYEPGVELASNSMLMLVQPGNPRGIRSIQDLSQPGLRVGLGHPNKSALGALTHRLLEEQGCLEALLASDNLKVESPTGDLLVNHLRTGSLDTAIVYTSNAALAGEEVERIVIPLAGAFAVQPIAIQRDTPHRQLLLRLVDALRTARSQARFEQLGFEWLSGEER